MKDSLGSKVFNAFNIGFFVIFALITLYPFWHVMVSSIIPSEEALKSGIRIWPRSISVEAYRYVFSNGKIVNSMLISLLVTSTTIVYHTLITAMLAYALSKKDLPGRTLFFNIIIVTMFFSGGLIPTYLTIKNLGLINNLLVLILPGAVNAYNMVIMKTFFVSLPNEIEQSAIVDGAGYFRIFFCMILPLSIPVVATIALFIAVGQWNNWFGPMIYLNDKKIWPLALLLRDILINNNTQSAGALAYVNKQYLLDESIKMAIIMISMVPVIITYPFAQRYFVKGVMLGSLKG